MNIETEDQLTELITNNKTVAIDFYADWCGPCKGLSKLLNAYEGDTIIAKVNVDEATELSTHFGVKGIPYVIKFVDGKAVDSFSGLISSDALDRFLG